MDEIMQEQPYKVLVRVDSAGRVVAINSSAFVQDAPYAPCTIPVRNFTSLDPFIQPVKQRRNPSEPEPIWLKARWEGGIYEKRTQNKESRNRRV